jgi:Fur family ferric uptake transcriptional regulator
VTVREQGARVRGTRQAEALTGVLNRLPGFRSAQDFYAELRREGESVGLTTVYRRLQMLSAQGEVDAIRDERGETLYRRCATTGHHHHVTCRSCGRTVEVEGEAMERWANQVTAEVGFVEAEHIVEIFGRCSECART